MRAADRGALAATFACTARCYWLGVFPLVRREVLHWQWRASEIPEPSLRHLALATQHAKWGNIEGAAAFAAFVPRTRRALVVRALSAWQAAYDYADTLSEQPNTNQRANGYQLHLALLTALEPGVPHPDYYAHHPSRKDNGYLQELVDTCRAALGALPSFPAVAQPARRAAIRIATYQSLNHGEQTNYENLKQWADTQAPADTEVRWWETAAAGASSLAVLALIAAAAQPTLSTHDAASIERAYFPWICSLHTLLDSLIDYPEDIAAGQPSLITRYGSPQSTAIRIQRLAEQSVLHALDLPAGRQHLLLLAAMTSLYLCAPEASLPHARPTTRRVLNTMGTLAIPTMLISRARRLYTTSQGMSRHN